MKLKASRPTLHNDVRFLFIVCLINLQGTYKHKHKYSQKWNKTRSLFSSTIMTISFHQKLSTICLSLRSHQNFPDVLKPPLNNGRSFTHPSLLLLLISNSNGLKWTSLVFSFDSPKLRENSSDFSLNSHDPTNFSIGRLDRVWARSAISRLNRPLDWPVGFR